MKFITDTQDKLIAVASKIHKTNPSAAARLVRLGNAVVHTPDSMAEAWSTNDIHQMIDAHVIAEQIRAKDIPPLWLRYLEWLRNLLIFLPLVLTWWGISNAVSSYSIFVTAVTNNPQADKSVLQLPFIYLWQQGFGGYLPSWITLGKLAFYDFVLLLALVVLTGIVNIRTHLRTGRKEREAEEIQEQLTDALSDAALCLTRRPGQQQIGNARDVLDQMEKERQLREQELTALQNMINSLNTISQNMLNGAMHIQQSTDQLKQVLQNLTPPVQQMAADQNQMLGEMRQLVSLQNTTTNDTRQLITDQQQWSAAMQQATNEMVRAVVNLNQLPAALSHWTNQLATLVNQLNVELNAQAQVSQITADSARVLQTAFSQIQDAATHLHSSAQDLFNLMNMQKVVLDTARASFGDVAQGGSNLTNAAQLLYNVANSLNGAGMRHP